MNTANTGGIPYCEWPDAKKPAVFRNCWDKDGCLDQDLKRCAAENRIQTITKQVDCSHGLTNKRRHALESERRRLERMCGLGRFSPVPIGELNARKEKATEKKLRWLAKNVDQANLQKG